MDVIVYTTPTCPWCTRVRNIWTKKVFSTGKLTLQRQKRCDGND